MKSTLPRAEVDTTCDRSCPLELIVDTYGPIPQISTHRQDGQNVTLTFELSVLRSRMLDATRAKARRGELRISVPIGYVWHCELGLDFDPDQACKRWPD